MTQLRNSRHFRSYYVLTILGVAGLLIAGLLVNYHLSATGAQMGTIARIENAILRSTDDFRSFLIKAEGAVDLAAVEFTEQLNRGATREELTRTVEHLTAHFQNVYSRNYKNVFAGRSYWLVNAVKWERPENFDPVSRDWYRAAIAHPREAVIVPPYNTIEDGTKEITVAKLLPDDQKTVIGIDIAIDGIRHFVRNIHIPGAQCAFIIAPNGFVLGHHVIGSFIHSHNEEFQQELAMAVLNNRKTFTFVTGGEEKLVFTVPVYRGWYTVVIADKNYLDSATWVPLIRNTIYAALLFLAAIILISLTFRRLRAERERVAATTRRLAAATTREQVANTIFQKRYAYKLTVNLTTGNFTVDTGKPLPSEVSFFGISRDFPTWAANFLKMVVPQYQENLSKLLDLSVIRDIADNGFIAEMEVPITGGAEIYWHEFQVFKGINDQEEEIAFVTICDVSSAHRQAQIAAELSAAEAANRAKNAFFFNMSHDLRTPMNAITGFINQAYKNIHTPERIRECLDKINIASDHLLRLINEIIDISRIESGKIILAEDLYDIPQHVKTVIDMCSENASTSGLRLITQYDNLANPRVLTDTLRFDQVLTNIISNAIKFTPAPGEITIKVEQTPCAKTNYAAYCFTVTDTGIGMEPEFIARIFDAFSLERSASAGVIDGAGLGMTIVRRILDLMGGEITVQSHPGSGTAITIFLTFKLPSADSPVSPTAPSAANDSPRLRGKRVLLVDDNAMNREITREILEDHGMLVEEAEDGDIAYGKVADSPTGFFDFILMDVQMPRMDGYDATRSIRALPNKAHATLPIIAMTANAFSEDRQKSLNAGMDAHLAKPISVPMLISTLLEFCPDN